MEILIYIGKVSLYLTLFYACYRSLLGRQTFFIWNRFYLLGSLIASFLLPFVIYPEQAPALPVLYEATAASVTVTAVRTSESWISTSNFLWALYLSGVLFMSLKLLRHIQQLREFLNQGMEVELDECSVIIIDNNNIGSFSFMKWIVVNSHDYENHFDDILRHEMVHMHQKHSFDILLIEFVKIIFWFNPILLLYKKSLQEVHEFLADNGAPNKELYARFLVSYSMNVPSGALQNHFFNSSQIKSRIKMMYKNRTSKWLLSIYALTISSICIVALIVAGCEADQPDKTLSKEIIKPDGVVEKKASKDLANDKKIFTVVEDQPQFPGGMSALYEFMGENLRYPEAASRAHVSGRVFLSFTVTETGDIEDVTVLKGLGFGCDEEAIRVLKSFPKWQPGKQDGKAVSVKYNMPINFQLKDSKSTGKKTAAAQEINKIQIGNSANASSIKISGDFASDDNAPLLIVDGLVEKNADKIKEMDPNTIKSVNVLKDESAVALYGETAKNGVIQITTK